MPVDPAFKPVPGSDFNRLLRFFICEQNAALFGTNQVFRRGFLMVFQAGSAEHAFLSVAHDVHDIQRLQRLGQFWRVPEEQSSVCGSCNELTPTFCEGPLEMGDWVVMGLCDWSYLNWGSTFFNIPNGLKLKLSIYRLIRCSNHRRPCQYFFNWNVYL